MDIVCEECGNTEFRVEDGFYYCLECDRRADDVYEQDFEEVNEFQLQRGKLLKTEEQSNEQQSSSNGAKRLTSWEAYNYILLGLVKDLIQLGADPKLKTIVKCLWLEYLYKCGVIRDKPDLPPLLQAFNNKSNAEIVYGRTKERRKRKRKDVNSASSIKNGSTLSRREIAKTKRAFQYAMQDDLSNKATSEHSAQEKDLADLKSSKEEAEKEKHRRLQFTNTARTELLKIMGYEHYLKHKRDVNGTMTCHKINSTQFSKVYRQGPEIINRTKLYAILYMGLLMLKDNIQLGDMLRYINEGHLSYTHVSHFIPDDAGDYESNKDLYCRTNRILHHNYLKDITYKVLDMMKIKAYFPIQNLCDLVRRYCRELALPDEIESYVQSVLIRTRTRMPLQGTIPNYEGRAIALIIFVLKLLYGLDNLTELKLSKMAELACHNSFNINEWIEFLFYRNVILRRFHFPTAYNAGGEVNVSQFIHFANKMLQNDDRDCDDLEYNLYRRLLDKLEMDGKDECVVQFEHSLTPHRDYLKQLDDDGRLGDFQSHIIRRDFKLCTLSCLFKPQQYLNAGTRIKCTNANDNIKIVPIFHMKPISKMSAKRVKCTLVDEPIDVKTVTDDQCDQVVYTAKVNKGKERARNEELKRNLTKVISSDEYPFHYQPEEHFWLNMWKGSPFRSNFDTFYSRLPYSFRLIVEECARVTTQSTQELLNEYNNVELFLCYCFDYDREVVEKNKFVDEELDKLMDVAIANW